MSIKRFLVPALAATFILTLTASATAPLSSVYSSLSGCKLIKVKDDPSHPACRGVGGYNLQILYDDNRESITVIDPNGQKHPLDLWQVISGGFSTVGKTAEWRVKKENKRNVPQALILRFIASENPEDSSKTTSYLAVAKITPQKICVTDKIAPGSTMNEDARRAADASADKPCME